MSTKQVVFALVCAFGLVSCQTTPTEPTDLASINETTKISYQSVNGTQGFADIVTGRKLAPQMLTSKLYLPEQCKGDTRIPAVIVQHGSGSIQGKTWYPNLAKKLNDAGIAALVADSYGNRGISDTSKNQKRLPGHTRIHDVFAAFRALQEVECIDPDRIGITGYSFGGLLSRYVGVKFISDKLGNGRVFKSSLPVYPPCVIGLSKLASNGTQIHYLLGGKDDWSLASTCIEDAKGLKEAGWDIDYTILAEGHHGFIGEKSVRFLPKVFVIKDCKGIYIDEDGITYWKGDAYTKSGQLITAMLKDGCATRGAHSGTSGSVRGQAMKFTVEFFSKNL